jgi:membrane protease YdiL (CAAX protease family)
MPETTLPPLPDSSPPDTRPIARWRWWVHLLLITSYVVLIGAMGFIREKDAAPALSSSTRGLLWTTGLGLLVFGLVFGGAWLASRASRDDLLLRWRRGFWPVPWGIGYSLALRFAVGSVAIGVAVALMTLQVVSPDKLQEVLQTRAPDVSAVVNISSLRDNPAYFWLMVTFVSFIVAGLREELWRSAFLAGLRGIWPRRFASRKAQIGAAALAAVIFGFGHAAQGPIAATAAGLLGLGLGAIMVWHRSIWPAVIAHGCFDATSFALLPWAAEKMREWHHVLGG